MIYVIETDVYYFVRKPYGVPSTFGKQISFLEDIMTIRPPFFLEQEKTFTKEEEYGLLNRLDNDTEWFLYFAKTQEVRQKYAEQQGKEALTKVYICALQGKVDIDVIYKYEKNIIPVEYSFDSLPDRFQFPQNNIPDFPVDWIWSGNRVAWFTVHYPIMHHAQNAEKMIPVVSANDQDKWRWNPQEANTSFYPMQYDADKNITRCYVCLHKWVRHQIRVHAASMWYPLVGDVLYNKKNNGERLCLWSIGLLYM